MALLVAHIKLLEISCAGSVAHIILTFFILVPEQVKQYLYLVLNEIEPDGDKASMIFPHPSQVVVPLWPH